MKEFPTITHMLRTAYNVEDGLSDEVSVRLYQRAAASPDTFEKLKNELQSAFSRQDISWRNILLNEDYEVFDAGTEQEAREYAYQILWTPIFGRQ